MTEKQALSGSQVKRYWQEFNALFKPSKTDDREALRQDLHRRAADICTADHGIRCSACNALLQQDRISLKDFDRRHGFDQLLAAFRAILDPADLNGQLRQVNQPKTRRMWRVRSLKTQLAAMGHQPDRYVARLLQDRFGGRAVEELCMKVFRPYGKSEFDQFLMTLTARVNDLRIKAGLTVDDLNTLSSQKCPKQLRNSRISQQS